MITARDHAQDARFSHGWPISGNLNPVATWCATEQAPSYGHSWLPQWPLSSQDGLVSPVYGSSGKLSTDGLVTGRRPTKVWQAQARTSSPGGRSRPTGMERRPRQQLLHGSRAPIHRPVTAYTACISAIKVRSRTEFTSNSNVQMIVQVASPTSETAKITDS